MAKENHHTLMDIVTYRKEISIGWLITFLLGGLANLMLLVWTASALVQDQKHTRENVMKLGVITEAHGKLLSAQGSELNRQAEVDNSINLQVKQIRERLNKGER